MESARLSALGIDPLVRLTLGLLVGLGMLVLAHALGDDSLLDFMNAAIPLGLVGGLLGTCIQLVRHSRFNLFRPLTAFLFSCALYHGMGPLLYTFGAPEQIAATKILQSFDAQGLTEVLILNQCCTLAVLLAYLGYDRFLPQRQPLPETPVQAPMALLPFMIALGLWGIGVKFLVVLPWDLKLTDQAPAGLLVGTQSLSYGTLFYLWYLRAQGRGAKAWPLLLTLLEVAYGLISLSKMALLLPLIAALLGHQAACPLTPRRWAFLGLGGLTLILLLQPMNTFLRYKREVAGPVALGDMVQVLGAVTDREALMELVDMRRSGVQEDTFWTRLGYVNVEAYVLARRAEGRGGDTYRYFKHLFIPRWVWPDKPVVNPGLDFNKEWLGSDNSSIGLTMFGEAYFNAGWLGVPLIGMVLALILRLLEVPLSWVLSQGRFEQSMMLFLGVFIGLRVDDWAIMMCSAAIAGWGLSVLLTLLWRLWPKPDSQPGATG